MLCDHFAQLTGFACHAIDDSGELAMIETPFKFSDGDAILIFVERIGRKFRFFDDGSFLMHFASRGVNVSSGGKIRFLTKACSDSGAAFNESGEAEAWSDDNAPGAGFSALVGAAHRLIEWESHHGGTSTDTAALIEEVAFCLQARLPSVAILRNPTLSGLSRQSHTFDFSQGNLLVDAIAPHHAAVGSLLRKLIDIKGSPHNQGYETLVVIDDRNNRDAAERESSVLSTVSPVMRMTTLVAQAGDRPLH